MRLTRKTLYALEAVVDIAHHARPDPVQSKDITQRQDIPQRYLESVLQHLVHAGILRGDALDTVDVAAVRACFEVNSLAPLCVTRALLPALGDGAKIAIITSRIGSIDDNTSGRFYAYRMSKAAVNIVGKSLAVDLAPRGVAVAILHPGAVRTQMTGGHGDVEPAHAAAGLIARIDELSLDTTGRFRHANGEDLPW